MNTEMTNSTHTAVVATAIARQLLIRPLPRASQFVLDNNTRTLVVR